MYLFFSILISAQIAFASYEKFNLIMKLDPTQSGPTALTNIDVDGPSAIARFGDLVYVTNLVSQKITVVNTQTDTLYKTYSDPSLTAPYNIVLSGDGRYAYIANYGKPLTVLDTTSGIFYPTKIYGNSLSIDPVQNQLFVVESKPVTQYLTSLRLSFFNQTSSLNREASYTIWKLYLNICDVSGEFRSNPEIINVKDLQKNPNIGSASSLTSDENYVYVQNQDQAGIYVLRIHRDTLKTDQVYIDGDFQPGNNGLVVVGNKIYSALGSVIDFSTGSVNIFSGGYGSNALIYDGSRYLYVAATGLPDKEYSSPLCGGGQAVIITPLKAKGGLIGVDVYKIDTTVDYPYNLVETYTGFNCPQSLLMLTDGSLYVLDGSGEGVICNSLLFSGQIKKISPSQKNALKKTKSLHFKKM
jgi:DNA-binding beta-propeller fold protein YncE